MAAERVASIQINHLQRLVSNSGEHATGGQKSVHEVWLTAAEKREVLNDMPHFLQEQDRFCLLRLDPRSRSHVLGTAEAPADPDYFYVG